jgi:hypothetical protein
MFTLEGRQRKFKICIKIETLKENIVKSTTIIKEKSSK